jgi:hypothetical protein
MKASRRAMLKSTALLAGLATLPWTARAQGKASKSAMKYQDKPNNGQECDGCVQFVPGASSKAKGTCKVVDGDVSPKGWCIAYVKKA